MADLSIMIPYYGADSSFEATLVSVLENRPSSTEVLVTHRGDYEDPYGLSDDDVRFVAASPETTPSGLIQAAIVAAEAEVVHLLQCGVTVLDETWCDEPLGLFADPSVGMASPSIVAAPEEGRAGGGQGQVLCRGLRYRPGGGRGLVRAERQAVLGPLAAAAFYRRDAVLEVGGFEPQLVPEVADVDLALKLWTLGYRCESARRSVVAAPPKLLDPRPCLSAGLSHERLFWRHAPQVGWTKALALHPVEVLTDTARSLGAGGFAGQLTGRAVGLLGAAAHRSFHRRMRRLQLATDDVDREHPDGPGDAPDDSGEVRRAAA